MTVGKNKNKRFPSRNEVKNAEKIIRGREFLYLLGFADVLNRYMDIKLKDQFNHLRNAALSLLIAKGSSLTPTQLAQLMLRSKHSLTRVIDSLEGDGFVVRERVSKDRRAVHVRITSDGLTFMMQSLRDNARAEEEIMSCLDKNETETLRNLTQRLKLRLIEEIRNH